MKKTLFTALRAMCVGAMTLFAVSCYDDSALWSEIEDLDARLTALEEKLNTEVATLNSKLGALETAYEKADSALLASVQKLTSDLDALDGTVDGYVKSNDEALKAAIDEYKKADEALAAVDTDILAALATMGVAKVEKNAAGNVVITFVDESTVEVGAADANANNTGLVTVVDGKWAVVGADGKTTVLDAELHPDTKLAFKVNVDNNELYVSYDDGATWEPTGVIVKDATTINVVTSFKDGEDFVTLTVGGIEYQLPKYVADNSSLVMGRTDVFFMYGATKEIRLSSTDIAECYVMTKPDGWKVVLDGFKLNVTAPSEELVNMGAGELEGQVLVHASSKTGACKVVSLNVTTGPAFTFSYSNGNLVVFNALTVEEKTRRETMTTFPEISLGIAPASEVAAYKSIKDYAMDHQYDVCSTLGYYYSQYSEEEMWYEEGVLEEQRMTIPLSFILEDEGLTLEENTPYVLWLLPSDGMTPMYDQVLFATTGSLATCEASNEVYNNADLAFNFFGADGVIIGATSKTYLDKSFNTDPENPLTDEDLFGIYLQTGVLMGYDAVGPFISFTEGDVTAMGTLYTVDFALSGTTALADVVLVNQMGTHEVFADNDYFVWMLPYYKDKALSDYTTEEIILFTCHTEPMVNNPDLTAEFTPTATHNSYKYTITPPEGCTTYHYTMPKTEYDEYMGEYTPEELAEVVKSWCNEPVTETYTYQTETWDGIRPGTTYVVMTYTEGNGEYGNVDLKTIITLDAPTYKQWVTESEELGEFFEMGTNKFIFELEATLFNKYFDKGIFKGSQVWGLGVSYEDIYGSDAAGVWMIPIVSMCGNYTLTVTDETAGVITTSVGAEIPYSEYDGESCVFDFTQLFGVGEVKFTLATEEQNVMING